MSEKVQQKNLVVPQRRLAVESQDQFLMLCGHVTSTCPHNIKKTALIRGGLFDSSV